MPSICPPRSTAWLLPGVLLILAGCTKPPETGTVSGTVKFKGAPVSGGTVNFHHTDKGTASVGTLDSSGSFTLQGKLEVGTYKVYVTPAPPEQLPPGKVAEKKPLNILPKYQDLAQTPVKQEVKAGPNTVTIDLD